MIFPSRHYIKELELHPSKKHGQSFLIDKNMACKAVEHAGITSRDTVIEIGPGLGALTCFLHTLNARTFSFEIDTKLFTILQGALPAPSPVTLVNQDILTVAFSDFLQDDTPAIIIGSIPYSITSAILLNFLQECNRFRRAVFIMQHEVARRLSASPGCKDYGIMTVYCNAYAPAALHTIIPSECFYPRPKVDSAIVELIPEERKRWNDDGESLFRQVLRASFSKRRKTLYNCLKSFLVQINLDPLIIRDKTDRSGLDLTRRAETLTVDEFYGLTNIIRHACSTGTV